MSSLLLFGPSSRLGVRWGNRSNRSLSAGVCVPLSMVKTKFVTQNDMKIGWVWLGNDNGLLNLWRPHVIWKHSVLGWGAIQFKIYRTRRQAWSGMRIRSLACFWRALVMWMDKGRRTFWSSTRKCTSKILRNISMISLHEKISRWFWSHRSWVYMGGQGRWLWGVYEYCDVEWLGKWQDRLGTCGRSSGSTRNEVRSFLILSIDQQMTNIYHRNIEYNRIYNYIYIKDIIHKWSIESLNISSE